MNVRKFSHIVRNLLGLEQRPRRNFADSDNVLIHYGSRRTTLELPGEASRFRPSWKNLLGPSPRTAQTDPFNANRHGGAFLNGDMPHNIVTTVTCTKSDKYFGSTY